ncbi:MAG: PEP-CTERM sorting domain-containing protein [Cyanobacteriota bacterium]|nr:PEP-CTERM sorting domain-containing protein [Cyanobacteriota bacterium]
MNTKKHFLTAAATTAIVGLASVAPAQAASFGTSGISFDKDTEVEFKLNQTYGIYKSFLNVYEVQADDSLIDLGSLFQEIKAYDDADVIDTGAVKGPVVGTCDNTILGCETTFTFEADKEYTLGLINYGRWQDSTNPAVTPRYDSVYSTTSLNTNGQQAVFDSWGGTELGGDFDASQFTTANIFDGWKNFSFDDGGNADDKDYQDFQLKARAVKTPEPTVLLGLAVVAGGMFLTRCNKNKAS